MGNVISNKISRRSLSQIRDGGLSMVELVISVLIMIPILLGILSLYFKNVKGVTESWEETRGTAVGQRLMGHIQRLRWDELTVVGGTIPVASATLGADPGEVTTADFDDVDDWDGYSAPDPLPGHNRFLRQVEVVFVTVNLATGAIVPTTIPTDYKRVTVKVITPSLKTISLASVYSNSFP